MNTKNASVASTAVQNGKPDATPVLEIQQASDFRDQACLQHKVKLSVRELNFYYGKFQALFSISLDILEN
ncbi:MAG: hypothetical protein JRI90_16575, partial [Deltaproteobacteria bacterium]|nr:hypothetical protein [Deltaproteobacteria bacterium]